MFHQTHKRQIRNYSIIFLHFLLLLLYSLVHTSPLYSSTIGKSGQTETFAAGDDGDLQKGVSWPVPRFTDNANGTITDNLTGLIWLKNADCFSTQTFQQSLDTASNLESGDCQLSDGSTSGDWHLPNIRQLESLIHLSKFVPSLPNTQGDDIAGENDPFINFQSDTYWSSTTSPEDTTSGFAINFQYGHRVTGAKSTQRHILLVHKDTSPSPPAPPFRTGQTLCYDLQGEETGCFDSGQDGESQSGTIWPEPRFTDPGDGTVVDNLTGLIWLKDASCFPLANWSGAISLANTLSAGSCLLNDDSKQGDWRLPNRKELESLIDYEYSFPALSDNSGSNQWSQGNPFLNIQPGSGYWTSTTYAAFTNSAWYIQFNQGAAGSNLKTDIAYLLPVRDQFMEALTVNVTGNGSGNIISVPAGIDCPGVCEFSFPRGEDVVLTATADSSSTFSGWSDESCGNSTTCAIALTASTTIEASFEKNSNTVPQIQLLLLD